MVTLHLYHGRDAVDAVLNDWGSDGPKFAVKMLQVTYEGHFKLYANNAAEAAEIAAQTGWTRHDDQLDIRFEESMAKVTDRAGKTRWYGDLTVA